MFYSQFILAKKGPLGTIWIAAHLERKLRKNQVADTDIGVSVDSILFPEVPIALRLSSHLLLGVVRIYSRKVNYLFHDCSEALLKVKQAFRSTAVDLPPEESTAPYHSITLPETFDLDDFELPDSEFFQGNYVDHHVSTREQITLQDTMEGVVISTSQFGLDERFGDGDTSQIGLDLDEDLFFDKASTTRHTAVLVDSDDVDPQASGQAMTPFPDMDIDDDENKYGEDRTAKASEDKLADASGEQIDINPQDQTTADDPSTDFIACEQVPSTPGLAEEGVPSNGLVQEVVTSNLQLDSESRDSKTLVAEENLGSPSHVSNLHTGDTNNEVESSVNNKTSGIDGLISNGENGSLSGDLEVVQLKQQEDFPSTAVALDPVSSDLAGSMSSPTSVLAEQAKPISPTSEGLDRTMVSSDSIERAEASHDGPTSPKRPSLSSVEHTHAEGVEPHEIALVTPSACTLEETCGKPLPSVESVDANSNAISDCQPVSEGMPEIDGVSNKETFEHQASLNVSHEGELNDLCSPSYTGTHETEKIEGNACAEPEEVGIPNVGSDEKVSSHNHMLRACNSIQHQSDVVSSLGDETLGESAPDSLSRGAEPGSLETLEGKEVLQASVTSAVVQGEECHPIDVTDTTISEANERTESVPCDDIQINLIKSDEHLDTNISKDSHEESLECPASSDLPAPEILLSAPEAVPDAPGDLLVESSPGKEVSTGREGSGDGLRNLSKRKRNLMESTPVLPDGNTANLSGATRSKRILDSVPDDDDLLSSILVGRRSSVLKMKPTPPQPEIPSSKRRRVTSRVSTPKRKVLLDDTMVLHGDTIRQQLTTTEDIRRIRKKAPCTRPEIWMIEKHLLEDDIFSEPLFTGMPADLIDLHNGTLDLSDTRVSEIDATHISPKAPNMGELSISADPIKEDNVEGTGEPVVVGHDGEAHEPADTLVRTENQLSEDHLVNSIACQNQEQTEVLTDIPPLDLTNDGQFGEGSSMEVDKMGIGVVDIEAQAGLISENNFNVSSVSEIELLPMDKGNEVELLLQSDENLGKPIKEDSLANEKGDDAINVAGLNEEGLIIAEGASTEKDGSCIQESENGGLVEAVPPNIPQEDQVNVGESSSSLITAPIVDEYSLENGTCVIGDASIPSDSVNPSSESDDHAKDGIGRSELEVVIEDEIMTEKVRDDEENSSNLISTEGLQRDSLCPLEVNGHVENIPLDIGENLGCQEDNLGRSMDEESNAMDTAMRDPVDIGSTMDGNDTEFLNFDDDEVAEEEEDNGMPNSEEPRFQENSGWSSRTRSVARYLQTMFDKESGGQVRKVIPVDSLLSGKTRKEASRMFFETLVLKTRDYIHVEQEIPFDNINIKPRVKLMKSDF
ncbi:Rad21/Rec8-like protein [Macleaya cordata]|uniref:Rad21/Rec8-like protein n=1 Tax=Macleaya cordata TaxID=56857 RepID=A0A200QJH5_MACCD|nr:Rad21/Rec8-like protein [Macleaya cordata]